MKRFFIKARNILLRILVLAAVFTGSLLFFERTINQVAPDAAQTMATSTFPLVYMVRGGVQFNCLHGYAQPMDTSMIRDSITPLSSDRQIGIAVQTFSASIESISYQVLTLDGSESLENTQVIKTQADNEYVTATLQLQNQMLMNQEYLLKLVVVSGGRSIYYYTHVLLADGLHTDDYLNFVSGFYDKTINRTDLDAVGAAVEPDETTDAEQTLAYMDIHDSVDQLTWASLRPQMFYKATPRIKEINTNTATLTNTYRISSLNDSGVNEVFNVHEYYRVRFTDSRVFLLNFERTTDEVFDPDNAVVEDIGIRLGITGKDVTYASDEKGRNVAFVQENELWTYERGTGKLTQVFSFPQKENMDIRDFYNAHTIHILHVSPEGDVWFTVVGYMNRGEHEGANGLSLCLYDAATDMVDEQLFVNCAETGEVLQRDIGALTYLSVDRTKLSFLLEEHVWQINLTTGEVTQLLEGLYENCFAGAASGRYLAYLPDTDPASDLQAAGTLRVLDLETGETIEVSCAADEKMRPLCYMNDDLVYGVARDADIQAGSLQTGYFPMYALKIMDPAGNVIKDYQPDGMWISGIEQADHMLTLSRLTKAENGAFTPGDPDEIMDTNTADSVAMGTATKTSERKQTQVYLRVGTQLTDLNPDIVRSRIIKHANPRVAEIGIQSERQYKYLVYGGGSLAGVYTRLNEAVAAADALVGVVVDTDLNYIWSRGTRSAKAEIPVADVPEVMRQGAGDLQTLAAGAPADAQVLDLTGCLLDEVLYFVDQKIPVQVVTVDGPRTIVGYDEYNTYLLRPGEEEWFYYGMNDSTEFFEMTGNTFYGVATP